TSGQVALTCGNPRRRIEDACLASRRSEIRGPEPQAVRLQPFGWTFFGVSGTRTGADAGAHGPAADPAAQVHDVAGGVTLGSQDSDLARAFAVRAHWASSAGGRASQSSSVTSTVCQESARAESGGDAVPGGDGQDDHGGGEEAVFLLVDVVVEQLGGVAHPVPVGGRPVDRGEHLVDLRVLAAQPVDLGGEAALRAQFGEEAPLLFGGVRQEEREQFVEELARLVVGALVDGPAQGAGDLADVGEIGSATCREAVMV